MQGPISVVNKLIPILLVLSTFMGCASVENPAKWTVLFDGSSLKNWETYLGPQFKEGVTWENIREQPAIGLNNDTAGVFQIIDVAGERVLRISGEIWGGISTKQEFENYHLQLQFKWGQLKWYPRGKPQDKRDSGLLYHAVGSHGEGDGFWLRSQEFQIQEGDCGDYWGVAGAMVDIAANLNADSIYQYQDGAPIRTFSEDYPAGRYCKKYPDAEKPGAWNTLDLYCFKGTSIHMVNGVTNMVLLNSRQRVSGKEIPLTRGRIQLQSESAEVFYRTIKIRNITSLPTINGD